MRIPEKDLLENLSEVPGTVVKARKYRVLIRARGETEVVGNGLRFDSEQEAKRHARDLFSRWATIEQWAVKETTEEE